MIDYDSMIKYTAKGARDFIRGNGVVVSAYALSTKQLINKVYKKTKIGSTSILKFSEQYSSPKDIQRAYPDISPEFMAVLQDVFNPKVHAVMKKVESLIEMYHTRTKLATYHDLYTGLGSTLKSANYLDLVVSYLYTLNFRCTILHAIAVYGVNRTPEGYEQAAKAFKHQWLAKLTATIDYTIRPLGSFNDYSLNVPWTSPQFRQVVILNKTYVNKS